MKKKVVLIGVACVILGLIITAWAVSVGVNEKPAVNQKRKSRLYRGLPVEPIYSKTYLAGDSDSYAFEPVLQGDLVKHDFIMKNEFQKPLKLKNAKSCCGSFVEHYTRSIEPGQEGRISILMITDRYGGRSIEGNIQVETDHPDLPLIRFHVSQPVKEFAEIDPYTIVLRGSVREELAGTATIVPAENYPFAITGIKSKKNQDILFSYQAIEEAGRKKYLVTAKNKRKREGIYRDVLFIQTDNPARPEFKIRIEGYISK